MDIGYGRVSTAEQANDSHALESQESRLRQAGCQKIICEVGSGMSDTRKGFRDIWNLIKTGQTASISVTRIDRISRKLLTLRQFVEDCNDRNVVIRAIDQGIFSDTPHGKFALNIMGSLAEWELDNLKERVDRGWKYLQESRRAPGIVPFGYLRGEDERYCPAKEVEYRNTGKSRWEVANEVICAVEKHCTVRRAVRELFEFYGERIGSKPEEDYPREIGLRYWLKNPVLRGHIGYYYRYVNRDKVNGRWVKDQKPIILIPNQHEALISPERWDVIERILEQSTRQRDQSTWITKPLAGLIRCPVCRSKFKSLKGKKNSTEEESLRHTRWYCNNLYRQDTPCQNRRSILNDKLEFSVHQALIEKARRISSLMEDQMNNSSSSSSFPPSEDKEIRKLRDSLASLDAIASNPAIEIAKADIERQIEILLEAKKEGQQVKHLLAEDLVQAMENTQFWEWLTPLKRRSYYLRFVESVWVLDGEVVAIDLRF